MRLKRLSSIGWFSAVSVVLFLMCVSMTFWSIHRKPSISEAGDNPRFGTEESVVEQVDTAYVTNHDRTHVLVQTSTTTEENLDPQLACEGVQWWKIEHNEMIPKKCLDALDRRYLDEDSGCFTYGGLSFGKSISFHRVFVDPFGDRERVLQALQQAECWTDNDHWTKEARRQNCHSDSFVSYAISRHLCQKIETRNWENSLQFHWVKSKCREKDKVIDEAAYFEKLANSQLGGLVEKYYERMNVRPSVTTLLLLALVLNDETAIGLSFDDSNLWRKYAWKSPLSLMSMVPDWEELGIENYDAPEIDQRKALEIALDVAVGLEEVGVEPNWRNLVDASQRWVTTDTDTLQEAISELRHALDPIKNRSKLRAISEMERIATH